jgi:hypothetical protein
LGEGGLEVFDDFRGDNVGIGKIGAVFEGFVFQPKNVEVIAGRKPALRREAPRL